MTAATSTMDTIVAQLSACHRVVHRNVDDVSNDEATIQPQPAGNTIFWVVRHITSTRERILRSVGQTGFAAAGETLQEILAAYDRSQPMIAAALGALTDDELDRKADFSPGNNPNETVRSLLTTVAFHEAYHTGQLGVLRRLVGKEGSSRHRLR